MNNKKGFTLVELMVTIVIMISILLLAIVSINEISDRQKQKALEQTRKQVVTAAKSYFSDNEYFISAIAASEEETAYISLGTLVKLDYINVVTNPIDGKKLDKCSVIVIEKGMYLYDENHILDDENCDMDAPQIGKPIFKNISNPDTPPTTTTQSVVPTTTKPDEPSEEGGSTPQITKNFKVELYEKNSSSCSEKAGQSAKETFSFNTSSKEGVSKWYNYANGIYLKIIDNDSNDPENLNRYVFRDNESCITTDGETKKVIVDSAGIEYYLTIKLDRVPPTISVSVSNSNWTNAASVDVTITLNDSHSKLNFERRYWNKSGLNQKDADSSTYKWSDSSISYPKGSSEDTSSTNIYAKSSYIHTERYSAVGYRKGKVKACDIAGNCSFSNEYYAKLDRTIPTVTYKLQKCDYNKSTEVYSNCKTYKAGDWSNKDVKAQMNATDDLSGVNKSCYALTGPGYNRKCDDTIRVANELHPGIHNEGISYVRFAVCDNAGNCYNADSGSTLYTIKLDKTAPVITSFANTKNKNCKTATGLTCYYSHNMNLADNPPSGSSVAVSGLSGSYKYNHCYDNASADGATGLICESGFNSTGSNKNEVLYTGGYANRTYSGSKAVQHYTYQYYTSGKYYNLFYKIYDKAGNYRCYRYKLNYTNSNKFTTAVPTYVNMEANCK